MPPTAAIEVPTAQTDARALRVILRTTNPAVPTIAILNPDTGIPSPAMNWPYSKEVYQTFLLMSFGYLSMSVTDEAGKDLPRLVIPMSATPALRPPLELGPSDSLEVAIPIGSFYQLESKISSGARVWRSKSESVSSYPCDRPVNATRYKSNDDEIIAIAK